MHSLSACFGVPTEYKLVLSCIKGRNSARVSTHPRADNCLSTTMSPTLRQFAPSDRQSPLIRVALVARKGGGGGGRGGGGGGGARASSGGKASSSSSVANSGRSASTFSKGGGKPSTVSSGAFAGRQIGGGTRDQVRRALRSETVHADPAQLQVYGTSQYGSGYPYGVASEASVAGRPFPFGFWPLYVSPGLYNSDEVRTLEEVLNLLTS